MNLILGGQGQGKLCYVLSHYSLLQEQVTRAEDCSLEEVTEMTLLYGLHQLVRRLLLAGKNPAAFVEKLLEKNPELIIITDEIGCGVVPMLLQEREWREVTGRICCTLAQKAHRVERVFCGLATTLKEV